MYHTLKPEKIAAERRHQGTKEKKKNYTNNKCKAQ
jgi:hypothetical protein